MEDGRLAWELTKMEIRYCTLPYCVKKKKKKMFWKKICEHLRCQIENKIYWQYWIHEVPERISNKWACAVLEEEKWVWQKNQPVLNLPTNKFYIKK